MADWAGAAGAGAAAASLEQMLAQKFLERKQAEVERAQRAAEVQAQAELAQRAELARENQRMQLTNLSADRDERYQDRTQRVGETNARMQRETLQDQIRAKERTEDYGFKTADREDEQKQRSEEMRSRQAFERSIMAARSGGGGDEPLVAIMDPKTNRPILVPRSQAAGQSPASTREQGRPVGTSDANRVADFDTSLDDLATLKDTLPKGSTGPLAQAAAAVPNWAAGAAETLSLGALPVADAKKKDAVISRVKQVIGKAFEGGVLRKEDEAKYEKILPNVSDSDEMVASKLAGLDAAIQQRRGTLLENLGSAGYDVTHFQTDRTGKSSAPGDTVSMRTPDGRSINVPAAMVAEAEKRGAKRGH
jgi:hypothetical protein